MEHVTNKLTIKIIITISLLILGIILMVLGVHGLFLSDNQSVKISISELIIGILVIFLRYYIISSCDIKY